MLHPPRLPVETRVRIIKRSTKIDEKRSWGEAPGPSWRVLFHVFFVLPFWEAPGTTFGILGDPKRGQKLKTTVNNLCPFFDRSPEVVSHRFWSIWRSKMRPESIEKYLEMVPVPETVFFGKTLVFIGPASKSERSETREIMKKRKK